MTPLPRFYRALRFILDDRDASLRRYDDTVLADAVRTAVELQAIPDYALTPAEDGLTPDVDDPNDFALVLLHTARLFQLPAHERYGYRTRGFSESFGSQNRFLSALEADIHKLENGEAFSGWQSLYAWFAGMSGLPVGLVLTELDVPAKLWSTSLSAEGIAPA